MTAPRPSVQPARDAAGADPAAQAVRVVLGARSYDVVIGDGLIDRLGAQIAPVSASRRAILVTDETVAGLYLDRALAGLAANGIQAEAVVLPPGEATKDFRQLEGLLDHVLAARPDSVERISVALASLLDRSDAAWQSMIESAGAGDLWRQTGELHVYLRKEAWLAARPAHELRRRRGSALEDLTVDELRQLEPALSRDLYAGVFTPNANSITHPYHLSQRLAEQLRREGGEIVRENVQRIESGRDGKPPVVVTDGGERRTDALVVSAGAFSKPFARHEKEYALRSVYLKTVPYCKVCSFAFLLLERPASTRQNHSSAALPPHSIPGLQAALAREHSAFEQPHLPPELPQSDSD
jgi:hypothetical protein